MESEVVFVSVKDEAHVPCFPGTKCLAFFSNLPASQLAVSALFRRPRSKYGSFCQGQGAGIVKMHQPVMKDSRLHVLLQLAASAARPSACRYAVDAALRR